MASNVFRSQGQRGIGSGDCGLARRDDCPAEYEPYTTICNRGKKGSLGSHLHKLMLNR